ncbi:FLYWCH-type zinc finger-containing protein 1 isoform X3 [Oryctolagus cuniculus]|uniref:FLYWCH-type zinc finger-containing protein 1 isoform X3 n=1 Tax=Oryctolagus cuniculus TaxID=9986 RepID=UPI00387992BE
MPLPEPREQEAESGTAGPEPSPELKRSRLDAAPEPLEFLRTPFGGRLLVHESFLYRQEKAVGDKVYWKCRRHAGLGCRGRAITRGARATVMRDHCHLPDEEGLRARPSPALPEALGNPQAPEGPGGHVEEPCEGVGPWLGPEEPEPTLGQVLSKPALEEEEGPRALSLPPKKRSTLGLGEYLPPMPPFGAGQAGPLEFLRTCYGGSFLVHESFLYKREKAVGDKVYWTCRDHTLHGCRSRAITQGQRVTVMRSHCHPPDVEGLEARRRQEKAGPDGLGAPEDKPLPAVDSPLCRRGPGPLALSRRRPRKRAKPDEQELVEPHAPPDPEADPGGRRRPARRCTGRAGTRPAWAAAAAPSPRASASRSCVGTATRPTWPASRPCGSGRSDPARRSGRTQAGEGGRREGVLDVPGPGPHGLPQPRHHPGPARHGHAQALPPARPGRPRGPAAARESPQPDALGRPRAHGAPGVPADIARGQVPGARVVPVQEGEGGRREGVLDVPGPRPHRLPQPRHHPGPACHGHAQPLPPARPGRPRGPAAAGAAARPGPAARAREDTAPARRPAVLGDRLGRRPAERRKIQIDPEN